MPKDPRTALGVCEALGVSSPQFSGEYEPYQTGGAGAGTIAPTATAGYAWPPAQISNVNVAVSLLPTYTPTGSIVSLPPPTLTPTPTKSIELDGWFNSQDTAGAPTPVAGCTYPPDPFDAVDAAVPPPCGTSAS
jgi:glucan 1,3-beta-glucosidase